MRVYILTVANKDQRTLLICLILLRVALCRYWYFQRT